MVSGAIDLYESLSIPYNEPADVASTYLHVLASGANGEALYVSGCKTYEIEKKLDTVRSNWLGEDVYQELIAGQQALGLVSAISVQLLAILLTFRKGR